MENYVKINDNNELFYCPVTGKAIIHYDNELEPSPATVFMMASISDEFDFDSKNFAETYHELDEDSDEELTLPELLVKTREKLGLSELVIFEVNCSGSDSCGMHELYIFIGIDFSTPYKSEE